MAAENSRESKLLFDLKQKGIIFDGVPKNEREQCAIDISNMSDKDRERATPGSALNTKRLEKEKNNEKKYSEMNEEMRRKGIGLYHCNNHNMTVEQEQDLASRTPKKDEDGTWKLRTSFASTSPSHRGGWRDSNGMRNTLQKSIDNQNKYRNELNRKTPALNHNH
jgi:hypothetical protein